MTAATAFLLLQVAVQPPPGGAHPGDSALVHPDGSVPSTIRAVRAEQAPTLDTDYVSRVGIDLQVGPDTSTRLSAGVNVLNHRPPLDPDEGGGGG